MSASKVMFAAAAVLWAIWGIVHVFAGVITVYLPVAEAVAGVADAVDPALLVDVEYPAAAGALINQHGFNLAWIGLTTIVCAPWVWRGIGWALAVAALVGGLADVGYFLFLDLGGFVHFVPGTLMTIVSGTAVLASIGGYFLRRRALAAT